MVQRTLATLWGRTTTLNASLPSSVVRCLRGRRRACRQWPWGRRDLRWTSLPSSILVIVSLGASSRFLGDRLSRQRRVRVRQLENILFRLKIRSLRSRAASRRRQKSIRVSRSSVDSVFVNVGVDVSTPYVGFYGASVPSSVTTSTSAAARAAHSASGSTSTVRVVNSEQRNQTTLCFPQRSTARCSA